jgi:hypothetical protein
MKYFLSGIIIFLVNFTYSQDTLDLSENTRKYKNEFAYCFLTINSNSDLPFKLTPTAEFLNGILIRRNLSKMSIRFSASFFSKTTNKDGISGKKNYEYGQVMTKEYKIGPGVQ